jgi:hypothetical protein
MAKPKLQNKCKLCNLIHQDRTLWTEIHNRILKDGAKKSHICNWLNKQVEIYNANIKPGKEELPKFNAANFSLHFSKHVSDEDKMKAELRISLKDAPRANNGFSQDEQAVAEKAAADASGASLAESYRDYPETVARLENMIMQDLASDSNLMQGGGLKVNAMSQRLKMLQDLMTVKKILSDVQKTDRVGGSAVRHAIFRLSEAALDSTKKLAEELKETLKQHMPTSSLPDDVESMITGRIFETLKGSSQEILEEVYKLYGIK